MINIVAAHDLASCVVHSKAAMVLTMSAKAGHAFPQEAFQFCVHLMFGK